MRWRRGVRCGSVEAVDAAGVEVAVVTGSAYDLYLMRTLTRAVLVRFTGGEAAEAAFLAGRPGVLAGVKQPLAGLVAAHSGYRVLPGRFMSIEQAMGTPAGRDPAGAAALEGFVAEMKASGFVGRALAESRQGDAEVAP